jgi:phenylpyruvate tautomerase PptA (4-oxalocrotonate tautomerase family)
LTKVFLINYAEVINFQLIIRFFKGGFPMPYISTKTNIAITKEKELIIKEKLGKAIGIIPGKSETWLMLSFEGEASLYFQGKNDKPIAFVEVKLFGKADSNSYNKLTSEITNILETELGIEPGKIYVKYEEVSHWGYNGNNF